MAFIREVKRKNKTNYKAEVVLKHNSVIYLRTSKTFGTMDEAATWGELTENESRKTFEQSIKAIKQLSFANVIGYEGKYLIYSSGLIYSPKSESFLKSELGDGGYLRVELSKNGVKTKHLIHRLVAKHFIDNPDNKPEVNHIDGNKRNCAAYNLEWATTMENHEHAENKKLKKRCKNCGYFV